MPAVVRYSYGMVSVRMQVCGWRTDDRWRLTTLTGATGLASLPVAQGAQPVRPRNRLQVEHCLRGVGARSRTQLVPHRLLVQGPVIHPASIAADRTTTGGSGCSATLAAPSISA